MGGGGLLFVPAAVASADELAAVIDWDRRLVGEALAVQVDLQPRVEPSQNREPVISSPLLPSRLFGAHTLARLGELDFVRMHTSCERGALQEATFLDMRKAAT